MFVLEKNLDCPPQFDLFDALVLYDAVRYDEARPI